MSGGAPRTARTDCFEDPDDRPLPGTPAPRSCPFCGRGSDDLQLVCFGQDGFRVECGHANAPDCGCVHYVDCMSGGEGPHAKTPLEAAQGWNHRHGELQP
jgi:hypothetical protein